MRRALPLVLPILLCALPWVGHAADPAFDVDAATREYLDRLAPEDKARSDAYFEGGYWLQLWGFLYGTAIYVFLLHSGLSAGMRDAATRISGNSTVQSGLYFVQFVFATTLLGFPLSVYEDFFREHAYGLSNQSFAEWMADRGKALALAIVIGTIAVSVLYALARRAGARWWAWGSVGAIALLVLGATVAPVYIAPLFNRYRPLEDGAVKTAVLRMAHANQIGVFDIWQSDASRQSKRISANVSGMLGTERITLNDNLLTRCSQPEVEAVMGHEIGHYVLNHAYKGVLFFGLVLTAGFGFAAWGYERLHARWGSRWRIGQVSDPAGLPALALLFGAYFFLLTPVTNSYTRAAEAEADLFGLNAARQPEGFAEVALKLGEYRKLEPHPLEELIFFDHPSGRWRIRAAMHWKAAFEAPPVDHEPSRPSSTAALPGESKTPFLEPR